jgi:RNA polymerase sigma-70 factor (ECF subfamily)
MTDPTAELVDSASRGNRLALDALLDRFLPGLEAFVRLRSGRLLLERESTADVVQSVCREVLEDLPRVKYENELHFKRWLYMTALRKIGDRYEYYRAEKRDPRKEMRLDTTGADASAARDERLLDAYASVCTPSRQAALREELARVESAFAKLPDEYREVISLARILGLPHAEVAAQMGRSEGATRALLFRALGRLSSHLEDPA